MSLFRGASSFFKRKQVLPFNTCRSGESCFFHVVVHVDAHEVEADEIFLQDGSG
jgi:hypothetical protein